MYVLAWNSWSCRRCLDAYSSRWWAGVDRGRGVDDSVCILLHVRDSCKVLRTLEPQASFWDGSSGQTIRIWACWIYEILKIELLKGNLSFWNSLIFEMVEDIFAQTVLFDDFWFDTFCFVAFWFIVNDQICLIWTEFESVFIYKRKACILIFIFIYPFLCVNS